jgi:hypothetical protein
MPGLNTLITTGTPLLTVHLAARASILTPLHSIRLGLSI